jgi:G3E family GTPase
MTVAILAGPASAVLLENLEPAIGVLASSAIGKGNDLAVRYELPANSSPEQILGLIRTIAAQKRVEHLVICCEPERPPMAYASLFITGTDEVARLTTTAFAVNATAFLDLVLGRTPDADGACFMAEQIEFVDHIFLGASTDDDANLAHSLARGLNPGARIFPLTEATVGSWQNTRSGAFDFEAALNNPGWRRLIDKQQSHAADGDRMTMIAYRARRPFHPERFSHFLQHDLQGVFRAKGFFWLASRMNEVGGLNLAGSELHCASAGIWWAARDERVRESEMPDRTRTQWQEPFGDRRQEFAVMALGVTPEMLQSQFDACLLTDPEMSEGPTTWKRLADPFPSWTSHHTHEHSHDHEGKCDHEHHHHDSDEHECCHH